MTAAPALPGRLVLLGHPVSHSLSPVFQNAALRAAGVPLTYEALDVTPGDLPAVLAHLRALGGAGNVTIPHKATAFRACDRVTDVARAAGVVNTFWTDAGLLYGDNTDVAGFAGAAEALGVRHEGAAVALLGAGGAAAAVCAAVQGWPGARVQIAARTRARAQALADRFPGMADVAAAPEAAMTGATLVVNATPVGLRDDELPIPIDLLPRDADVMDLVYRPGGTAWVRRALALGHRALDGKEMLLRQGALAFARWFGREPDLQAMRAALERASH